ncbi:MAG: GntR family transcriptional regulator [Hyphomicrobium sp.]
MRLTTVLTAAPQEGVLHLAGPLYLQVADHLRSRIFNGEWSSQEPLPNEAELATYYHVSLGTMRKALELLARQMHVVRHQGRGTFVTKHASLADKRFWPLSLNAEHDGFNEETAFHVSVLSCESRPATNEEAMLLSAPVGTSIVRLFLKTNIDPIAISYDTLLINSSWAPSIQQQLSAKPTEIPGVVLQAMGGVMQCSDRIDVALAGDNEAQVLEVEPGRPILTIDRQGFDNIGRVQLAIKRRIALSRRTRYLISMQ